MLGILLPNLKIENQIPEAPPPLTQVGSNYSALTVTGPFTVDNRITGAPAPYSIRRLSLSSKVLRADLQTLALQVIGEWPVDSRRKLVFNSEGTLKETGPFTASATK